MSIDWQTSDMNSRQISQIIRMLLGRFGRKNKFLKLVVLAVGLAGGYLFQNYSGQNPVGQQSGSKEEVGQVHFTHHAKCRMGCRKIDREEVFDVLKNGQVNARKSDAQSKPCPTQSLEKRSRDQQLIRVVVANCPQTRKIITVIDLENKYQCNCR